MPGNVITGIAFALNVGPNTAKITGSDIAIKFVQGKIGMNYPGWGDPGHNPLRDRETGNVTKEIKPGAQQEWRIDKVTVPNDIAAKDLYVMGSIRYKDKQGTRRGLYFAMKYDPALRGFGENPNATY